MGKKNKIFYGWLLCFSGTLMLIGGAGIVVNSASQFLKPVCEALAVSRGQFSIYISSVSVASMLFCPLIGKVYEKYNPRIVTICGGVGMAAAWICLSWAKDIKLFYLLGFLIGAGSSLCGMVSINVLMNNWFHAKKGTAMGIALTGSGIGSMIFNPLANKLIATFGYAAAYRYLGVCILICLLPIFILYQYRPEDIGLQPLGLENGDGKSAANEKALAVAMSGMSRKEALKTPTIYLVCFIVFGLSASSMGLFTHMMAYFTDIGFDKAKAASFISIISLGMAFGKLFFGWLNDTIGTEKNFMLMASLGLLGIALLSISRNTVLTLTAAIFLGIAVASPFVLSSQVTIFSFGSKDFPNIYGFVTFFLFLGPSLAPPLSGWIYDINGSYALAFLIYGILQACVLIAGFILFKRGGYEKRMETSLQV